jgi:hypothetical protein
MVVVVVASSKTPHTPEEEPGGGTDRQTDRQDRWTDETWDKQLGLGPTVVQGRIFGDLKKVCVCVCGRTEPTGLAPFQFQQ